VFFAGAAGVLAQDNANFFFDDTNNRLRLGTNPSTTGTLNLPNTGAIYSRNAANSADLELLQIDASNHTKISFKDNLNFRYGTGAATVGRIEDYRWSLGTNSPTASTTLTLSSSNAAFYVPLRIDLAAAQSADAFQVYASDGTTKRVAFNSNGTLITTGLSQSEYAIDIDRTTNTGNSKGIRIVSGDSSNLAGGASFVISAAAEDRNFLQGFDGAASFLQTLDSATLKFATSGGVGGREMRFQPGLTDRIILPVKKDLTDNTTTSLFEVALPTLKGTGGVLKSTVFASDGTEVQSRSQIVRYSAVNKAGAYTTEIAVVSEAISASAGTLTGVWTILNGADKVTIQFLSDSSLVPTTQWIHYTIESFSDQAVTLV